MTGYRFLGDMGGLAIYPAETDVCRPASANYGAAGNMLAFKDPIGSGTRDWSAFYDAENKQRFYCDGTTAACSSSNDTAEYVYDGEGNRVKKITSGETTTYVYDAFGRLAAEYSTAGPSGTAGSYFRTTDHLGSTRLVTNGSGNVHDRRDFFPFGEKILANSTYSNRQYVTGYNNASAASAHLFTAKERDQESGLDYFMARYYGSSLGRFTSADAPFADQYEANPQSWNLYQYGYNNPLANVDIDGRSVWTKILKVGVKVYKTGDAAAAFADNVQDAATLVNPAATPLQRIGAGLSLASELLPVSVGDVKDAGRLIGAVDDVVDAGKQVVRHGDDVKDATKRVEGIYEFSDAAQKGKTYVGQSGDVPGRLNQHIDSGKLAPGSTVTVTGVSGGKTAREVAEQKRINQLGGTANNPGSQTSNQRNPIGPKRQQKVEEEYGPLH